MEITGEATLTFHLGVLELSLVLDTYPFKFTPFDIHLAIDPLNRERYCTGVDYKVDTLKTDLKIKLRVNECSSGVFDAMMSGGTASSCNWKSYSPQMPLYEH